MSLEEDLNESRDKKVSNLGDLTPIMSVMLLLFKEFFNLKNDPAIAVCFQLPEEVDAHWITNVSEVDGIKMFNETASAILDQIEDIEIVRYPSQTTVHFKCSYTERFFDVSLSDRDYKIRALYLHEKYCSVCREKR